MRRLVQGTLLALALIGAYLAGAWMERRDAELLADECVESVTVTVAPAISGCWL